MDKVVDQKSILNPGTTDLSDMGMHKLNSRIIRSNPHH